MSDIAAKKGSPRFGLGIYLSFGFSIVFACAAVFLVNQVNKYGREQALLEAQGKAQLTLDRNLAIHTYFSHMLKPKMFELAATAGNDDYFEPVWMSSTYAVRKTTGISNP